TLPALTQTALLHVNGELADRELVKRFLHIYQSSSPSYLLMASIDNALHYIEKEGDRAFGEFRRQYDRMLERLSQCRVLRFLPADRERQDLGKLLISVKDAEMTGRQLYDTLLNSYRIQTEMAAEDFVLAMFTINDRPEGYERMTAALLEIDGSMRGCKSLEDRKKQGNVFQGWLWPENPDAGGCTLTAAWDGNKEEISLEEGDGRFAGEFVNLYPPGIPLLVPGERITKELCQRIHNWLQQGLTVQGVRLQEGKHLIQVLENGR
ncbi:MAG: hypothetical protein K2J60_16655, partial [Acetatifactor sp.]|nr:hypothetical protein [Acetatifactor sp.]